MASYGTRYIKKKTPYGLYFALLVIFLIVGYFVSGLYNIPNVKLNNLQDSLLYCFMHPLSNWNEKTPAVMGAFFILWFMLLSYFMYYYRNFQSEMEHGDANWVEPEVITKELSDKEEICNRILSESLRISCRGGISNNNMMIIGSSGSFKTTSIMHQNLLQGYGSKAVLDVKGDTQRKLGNEFIKMGYKICSLNFKEPDKSDRYNPFQYIENEEDILRIRDAIHEVCRPQKETSCADPFWDDAVKLYAQALYEHVWLKSRENGKVGTMNDVMELCRMESRRYVDKDGNERSALQDEMDKLAAKYGDEYPPVRDYRKLKDGAPDTVNSVILMLNGMFSICETAEVKRIFSGNDIDIRELGTGVGGNPEKPVMLFLVIPDNIQVYNWIVSVFYTQMFDILIRLSDNEIHGPLPVPVEVWMDEFYAGARPANTDVLLGVVRSRNISMIIMLQSIAQVQTLYKENKWETMMDNLATVVYLGSGPAAKSTHEWISNLLSTSTVDSRSDNVHLGANGNSGLDFHRAEIKLMTPEQVKRMPPTECIVFIESRPPVYDRKAIPFDKPDYGFVATDFLKKRYSEALGLGEYEHPVHTVYDPIHFRYITVEQEKRLQVVTKQEDIESFQEAAKNDPRILTCNIDETELLYLNWNRRKCSIEEVQQIFMQTIEAEKRKMEDLKGLSVLQDVDGGEIILPKPVEEKSDKTGWNMDCSLREILSEHWNDLSQIEQEEICIDLASDLNETQIKEILRLPVDEMEVRRRAYILMNKDNKKQATG